MNINEFSVLGLRVLRVLDQHRGDYVPMSSSFFRELTRNHLIKVANHMSRCRLIDSMRGRHGGLRYRPAIDDYTLAEYLATMEPIFPGETPWHDQLGQLVLSAAENINLMTFVRRLP